MTTDTLTTAAPLPTLTVFRELPPFAVGFARDMRVRWALEEAQRPYRIHLLDQDERDTLDYRARQPFGQMPVFEDSEVTLFESGAILHHIALDCPDLMPQDAAGRARTLAWMFAALNSFEQDVMGVIELGPNPADTQGTEQRQAALDKRLASIETWLTGRDYLLERFTVADILMAWELKLVETTGALERYPVLAAYYRRCGARPAHVKALADHRAVYEGSAAN